MKFALVTETFPPEVNGVSMTLGRLCQGLSQRGWKVQVARPVQEDEEYDARREASPYEEIVVPGIPIPGYSSLRMGEPAVFSLHRSWRRERPDIVHVATEGPLGIAALVIARLLKLPVSSTFHTNFDQYSDHYRVGFIQDLMAWYLKAVHNTCGCTLAPTHEMAESLSSIGYRNAGVMSRGVDTELYCPSKRDEALRASWGLGKGGRAWVYVGRVAKEKNIELALQTFGKIAARFPSDRMIVVGDGPELSSLRRKYPNIYYAGMRKGVELAAHYASGDAFLFPSVTETFGNVVTEAMASGLAVVTYDYAAGREFIVSGESGMLAAYSQSHAFEEAALALGDRDDAAWSAMRIRARQVAEGISWEKVVSGFIDSVCEVIARHRVAIRG